MSSTVVTRATAVAAALVLSAGLAAVAAIPTGAPSLAGVVPNDARLAAVADVGAARVLLLVRSVGLSVQVAYPSPKGWLAVDAPSVPVTPTVGWTATAGGGDVPALSAIYGTASGSAVRVTWRDGSTQMASVDSDGTWLVARHGDVTWSRLAVLARDGSIVRQMVG